MHFAGTEKRQALELAGFDLANDALDHGIFSLGVVFLLEAGLEGPGEDLVEGGAGGPEEGLDDLKAGLVAFSIYKFDEKLSLSEGELLHLGRM